MGVRVVVVVVAGLIGTHSAVGQNTGPGGVGGDRSSLVVWLSIHKGVTVHNGTDRISRVKDMSGYNYGTVASASDASSSPTSVRNALNGLSVARFDGVDDFLEVSDNPTIDLTQWSFFIVLKENTSKNANTFFSKGILDPNFKLLCSNGRFIASPVSYRDNTSSNDIYGIPPEASNSFYIYQYDYDNVNFSHYRNLTRMSAKPENRIPRVNEFPLYLGRDGSDPFGYFGGDIAEFLVYNRKVNLAEQILITNHLAARYGLTLPKASEVYTMDDAANGDYDYDVAGIGQASDGSSQRNASGPDIVRVAVENPLTMVNGEFFMWGHKGNTEINSHILVVEGDVDGKIIQERLRRVWRVSEVGDVGSTTLSFDLNGFTTTNPKGSNLRLMIDRDGDGFADNDITPQGGGTYAGKTITFSKVNLRNGDRFTLGNTDRTIPLPIELLSFTATPEDNSVKVAWSTASESNHDYFMVQHSVDGETWEDVLKEKGAGDKSTRTDYEGTDNRPHPGTSYYRLKLVDRDGKYSYSQIKRVEVAEKLVLKIYPNPVMSGSFLVVTGFEIEPENIQLADMMGEIVPLKIFKEDEEVVLVEPVNAGPGVYILHVTKGYWKQSMRVVMR